MYHSIHPVVKELESRKIYWTIKLHLIQIKICGSEDSYRTTNAFRLITVKKLMIMLRDVAEVLCLVKCKLEGFRGNNLFFFNDSFKLGDS